MSRAPTKTNAGRSGVFYSQWPKATWRRGRQPKLAHPRGGFVDSYYPPEKYKEMPGGFVGREAEASESAVAAPQGSAKVTYDFVKFIQSIILKDSGMSFNEIAARVSNQQLGVTIPDQFIEKVRTFKFVCSKCGRNPAADVFFDTFSSRVVMQFNCHGEIDQWTMSEAIMNAPLAMEKMSPFSRIPAGTKKLDSPITRADMMATARAANPETRIVQRDKNGFIVAIAESGERSVSRVPFINDFGIVIGDFEAGSILNDVRGNAFAIVTGYGDGRVSVTYISDSRMTGEYLTEGAEARIARFKNEILGQPLGVVKPSIIIYFENEFLTIDPTGLSFDQYDKLKALADSNPDVVIKLAKAGLLNNTGGQIPTGNATSKIIPPREREHRQIDLNND